VPRSYRMEDMKIATAEPTQKRLRGSSQTFYVAYSCCGVGGNSNYACDMPSSECGHQHSTPSGAATCIKNVCTDGVMACHEGEYRRLLAQEQEEVDQEVDQFLKCKFQNS
jgi:hypothetical protein